MSTERPRFSPVVRPHEVPPHPDSSLYVDQLRWAITVMDGDDTSLPFVAGLLAYATSHDGCLTRKQGEAFERVRYRVYMAYLADELECQQRRPTPEHSPEPQGDPLRATVWEPWITGLDIRETERDVLRAIACQMNADGIAEISFEELARVSRRSGAATHVRKLEARGIITVERSRARGKARRPNRYGFAAAEAGQ